jgi:hypothetical protein
MASRSGTEDAKTVRVTLVADPGLPIEVAQGVATQLPELLSLRLSATSWVIDVRCEAIACDEQVDVGPVLHQVGGQLPHQGWDIGIGLTDLPRRSGTRPVVAEVNRGDRIGMVSLPALGSLRPYGRAREAILQLTGMLSEEGTRAGGRRPGRVLGREATDDSGTRFVVPGLRGRLRLFAGMVRANRPWRLFLGLSKALAVVFATAAFGLANGSVWRMADTLSPLRQLLFTALSIIALVIWLVVNHELWERPSSEIARERAVLYNAVTVTTLMLGVLCLYGAVFLALALITPTVITSEALRADIGHVGPGTYLALAWFATSMAMVGGAIGSGFEADSAVRQAAYGKRQRERRRGAATTG